MIEAPPLAEHESRWGPAGSDPRPVDVVTVRGPDALAFLQGQCSQDLEGLAVGAHRWSFVLQPTGKVDAWVRVARTGEDEATLSVDPGFGEALLARLARFKLRTKAELSAQPAPGAVGGDEAFTRWRVAHAWPAMGAEITDEVLPAELGQWIVDASVSFTKGCYTGQELVARIDSRGGNVPHHLRRLDVAPGPPPVAGTALVDGDRSVGRITTSVADGEEVRALAFVHRSVAPGSSVALEVDGREVRVLAG